MPTYQYACTECGEQLEAVQKFSDDPLTVCPACDGKLRKVFSAVGIVFKGSGFYRTDSRSGSSSSTVPAANGSEGSGSSGDAKSDAKSGEKNGEKKSESKGSSDSSKSTTSSGSSSGEKVA